jgi:hypothetical protein
MKRSRAGLFVVLALACAASSRASAQADEPALPQGYGLSARYTGDHGIADDPAVLFAEDFEAGDLDAVAKHWDEASNRGGRVLSLEPGGPDASPGKRCLKITATLADNTGGHLYTRLRRGVDRAFARFYVRFPESDGKGYIHHFVHFGGYRPSTRWPQGGAGTRPAGNERFTVGIEPYGQGGRFPAPGAWNFYAYWCEMKISADRRYWGNGLNPVQPQLVPRDRWQCVEVMIQCNTFSPAGEARRDGELALWLDGKLAAHIYPGAPRSRWTGMGFSLLDRGGEPFEGFKWRTSPDLNVNFFWLLHYVTDNALRRAGVKELPKTVSVMFDHVVVATQYVGPIKPAK